MIEEPLRLVFFEYRDEMPGGSTRPMLVAAMDEDGNERKVVLKVRTPDVRDGHYGGTSLACELICAVIARAVDVPVPDYAIVDVPAELPPIRDDRLRALLTANVGPNFGSVYQEGYVLWNALDRPTSDALIEALEDVLALDSTLINGDRRTDKPNLLWRGDATLAIDHSLALPVHQWPADAVTESPLLPELHVRRHATYTALVRRGRQYSRFIDAFAGLTEPDFDRIREMIPPSWELAGGHLDTIFMFLKARAQRAAAITDDLRRILQ